MPYKNPEKQKEVKRKYAQKRRAKERLQREKNADPLDLNFGMKPRKNSMSFEEYQKLFPDSTKRDWINFKISVAHNEKEERERIARENKSEVLNVLTLEPVNSNTKQDCLKFRMTYLHGNKGERFYNHLETCMFCNKWVATYKRNYEFKPFNIETLEFPEEKQDGEDGKGMQDITSQNDPDIYQALHPETDEEKERRKSPYQEAINQQRALSQPEPQQQPEPQPEPQREKQPQSNSELARIRKQLES